MSQPDPEENEWEEADTAVSETAPKEDAPAEAEEDGGGGADTWEAANELPTAVDGEGGAVPDETSDGAEEFEPPTLVDEPRDG